MFMKSISRVEIAIIAAFVALMAATRFHHFGSAISLPDASLAVFFIAGFYLRSSWLLVALLALAALIDYLAISVGGVSDWCVTPAYFFLIPTYAVMWFAGRWVGARHRETWMALAPLAAALAVSVTVAFVISNVSFYFLSGRLPETGLMEYGLLIMKYFPLYAGSAFAYVAAAVALHVAVAALSRTQQVAGTKS
jgi:hypothetical protein